jgi:hypothetical protein
MRRCAEGLSAQTPHGLPPNLRDGLWTYSLPPCDPTLLMSRRVPLLGACKHVCHGSLLGTRARSSGWTCRRRSHSTNHASSPGVLAGVVAAHRRLLAAEPPGRRAGDPPTSLRGRPSRSRLGRSAGQSPPPAGGASLPGRPRAAGGCRCGPGRGRWRWNRARRRRRPGGRRSLWCRCARGPARPRAWRRPRPAG